MMYADPRYLLPHRGDRFDIVINMSSIINHQSSGGGDRYQITAGGATRPGLARVMILNPRPQLIARPAERPTTGLPFKRNSGAEYDLHPIM